jgi:hypothetical protein
MLDATTEASNRNAQDLALTLYKNRMGTILNGQGGRVPFQKEVTLHVHHESAFAAALMEFQSIATMGLENQVRQARMVLCERIEAERVRCFEINAMRNPFRDLEMYALPAMVAMLGWIMATVTDVTCSHDICEVAETSFKNIVSLQDNSLHYRTIPYFLLFFPYSAVPLVRLRPALFGDALPVH